MDDQRRAAFLAGRSGGNSDGEAQWCWGSRGRRKGRITASSGRVCDVARSSSRRRSSCYWRRFKAPKRAPTRDADDSVRKLRWCPLGRYAKGALGGIGWPLMMRRSRIGTSSSAAGVSGYLCLIISSLCTISSSANAPNVADQQTAAPDNKNKDRAQPMCWTAWIMEQEKGLVPTNASPCHPRCDRRDSRTCHGAKACSLALSRASCRKVIALASITCARRLPPPSALHGRNEECLHPSATSACCHTARTSLAAARRLQERSSPLASSHSSRDASNNNDGQQDSPAKQLVFSSKRRRDIHSYRLVPPPFALASCSLSRLL